jgi:DNA-directed RNA polymerase beta subunit
MAQSFTGKKRIRKSFGRIPEAVQMPNLIEVQRSSYEQFLQRQVRPGDRRIEGIEAVFRSVFPIKDFNERATLEYVSYEFEEPKYDEDECIQRDMTYAAPLKVKLRLIVFETDEETQARSVKDIKEQDVYMGDIPLMTEKGTFIVNGTERVIVLARLRVRRQGHRLRAHRPAPQAAGHHLPLRPRDGRRGDPHHLLRRRAVREARRQERPWRLGHALQARALARR